MIRSIKTWWIVRSLYKECEKHSVNQSLEFLLGNNKVVVERGAFVSLLADKSIKRFSWLGFLKKYNNSNKLSKRAHEYNSLIDSAIKADYIVTEDHGGRIFFRTTSTGDDFWGDFFSNAILKSPIISKTLTVILYTLALYYLCNMLGITQIIFHGLPSK